MKLKNPNKWYMGDQQEDKEGKVQTEMVDGKRMVQHKDRDRGPGRRRIEMDHCMEHGEKGNGGGAAEEGEV